MSLDFHKLQDKRVFYILAGTLVILLVLFVTLLNRQKKLKEEAIQSQNQNNTTDQAPVSFPIPQTQFAGYTLSAELPSIPTSVKLSDLKTSYTTGEALDLATNMGFTNPIVDEGVNIILVTSNEEEQQTMLNINKKNGNWLFVSEKGVASTGSDPTTAANSFLKKIGFMDDSLVMAATYTRESYPDVTFVEFHRSWEKLGLPYLNPLGVLNLDETENLTDLKLGYLEKAAPDDPDVTSSSDGYTGKVRPNGFNTITVAVNNSNNTILNATSNIKVLSKSQSKSGAETLKTPEEAFEEMKSGKVSFSMVKPTGEGTVDLASVFPNSLAASQNAEVSEVILTYLDELGQTSQNSLYPYYLFRGTATLDSGYDAQFVQTVPAVKQINTLGIFAQNSEPTVFPGQGSTLQYGTFNWLSPAPNPKVGLACAGLTQIFQFPNGAYIGWYPNTKPRTWYYVPPPGETVDQARIDEVKTTLRWEAAKACKGSLADPDICGFDQATTSFDTACYFAGATSPIIYVYSKTTKQIQVNLPKDFITYTDPPASTENSWDFTFTPDNNLIFSNGLIKSKLYYEYDKKVFNSEFDKLKNNNRAFLTEKSKLTEFVNSISKKAGLNVSEKAGLMIELTRETKKLSSANLKIGLLDREIIDKILPVSITPQPKTNHRFFLYVTEADPNEQLTSPNIEKLKRVDDMMIELGVLGF